MLEEDPLFENANDGGLKITFVTTSTLHTFWIKVKVEYPDTKAPKSLLPFPASRFCEVEFAAATATRTMIGYKQHT